MKAYFFGVVLLAFVACKRNTVPSKPTHTATSSGTATKPAEESATVVVSGDGKVVNSTVKTASGSKVYPVTSVRSFTPNQKKNLMLRFKTVPPKVLHVPESLAQKNAKGSYYVYKNKFWYWKASDGYYYLDENYYN
jgi:hypothetical protein